MSWAERIGNWLLTNRGKTFSMYVATAASIGVFCAHGVPHTVLLHQYQAQLQLYKHGKSVEVPKPLLERFNKAMDLLEIKERDRKQFKPFMCIGINPLNAGSFLSVFGSIIGLPVNYTWIDIDHIDKRAMRLYGESVMWETEAGQELLKWLIVPEKAQLYAIAHEIEMTRTPKLLIYTLGSSLYSILTYAASYSFNERLKLYGRARALRMMLYTLIGTFSIGSYLLLRDFTQCYYEKRTDAYLKGKSPIFDEGGREFFAYTLNRNIAVRELLGKEGETVYSALGNELHWFRHKHLPIVERRLFFEPANEAAETAAVQ